MFALHAPEVSCIGKGKVRQPYESGCKVSSAIAHKAGLIVGARSSPDNPFDGHTLANQIEQTTRLLQGIGPKPHTAVVDLGFRGVDADNPGMSSSIAASSKNSPNSSASSCAGARMWRR